MPPPPTALLASHTPALCPDTIELLPPRPLHAGGSPEGAAVGADGPSPSAPRGGAPRLALLGSYHLDKDTGVKTGELGLLALEADPERAGQLRWAPGHTLACRAVFDAKVAPVAAPAGLGGPLIAVATAGGVGVDLVTVAWGGAPEGAAASAALAPLASHRLAPDDPDVSALSLGWVPPAPLGAAGAPLPAEAPRQLLVSRSDGRLSLVDVEAPPGGGGGGEGAWGLREAAGWQAHALCGAPIEVWVGAPNARWDPHVAWSGGDDGTLKGWDLRTAGEGCRPTFTSTAHSAGVTCVEWHPRTPHVVATGSYDERVLLWDDRAVGRGPLADAATGGGVWRLRWHPHPTRGGLLAAACMYNGAQLLRVPEGLVGGAPPDAGAEGELELLAHHTAHASITYGVEWVGPGVLPPGGAPLPTAGVTAAGGDPFALATCSFYDRTVHLWQPGGEAAA